MKARKLSSSLAVAAALVAVAPNVHASDVVPGTNEEWTVRSNEAYDVNRPQTWRQTQTPFSKEYYSPSREKSHASFGEAGCGSFATAVLWLKSGYKPIGFDAKQAGQWLDTIARDYSKSYSADESPKALTPYVINDKNGVTAYYQAYLGDYMDVSDADPGIRYFSTAGDERAFGERKNDKVSVWSQTLADKYPQHFVSDPDEFIREQYTKGRFIAIIMSVSNGEHIAVVDEVRPDGTIVMVDSGGGYKYWEGMKRGWNAKAMSIYSYQSRGLDAQEAPKFWQNESPSKAKATIEKYTKELDPDVTEVYDPTITSETEKVSGNATSGRALKHGTVKLPKGQKVVSYGAKVIPFETKYVPNKSLEAGAEKVTTPGITGRVNTKHNFKIEKRDQVVEYGPAKVSMTVERVASIDLAPGKEEVIQQGKDGFLDRDGGVLEQMTPHKVKYGAKEIAYSVKEIESPDVLERTVKTKGVTGRVDDNGKVLVEKVDEEVLVPRKSQSVVNETLNYETKYSVNKEMAPGTTKVVTEGVNGERVNGAVTKEPVTEVIEYGPYILAKGVTYKGNDSLKPNERLIVEQGHDGLRDLQGNVIEEPKDMVIEKGPDSIPYETEVKLTTDLPAGSTKTVRIGKLGLRSTTGKVLKEPRKEVILKGVESVDDLSEKDKSNLVSTSDFDKDEKRPDELDTDVQNELDTPVDKSRLVDSPEDVSAHDRQTAVPETTDESTTSSKDASQKQLPKTGSDAIVTLSLFSGSVFAALGSAAAAMTKRRKKDIE